MRALARLSVRVRTTLAATAIVAVALGVAAAALVGVLRASLNDSAEADAEPLLRGLDAHTKLLRAGCQAPLG